MIIRIHRLLSQGLFFPVAPCQSCAQRAKYDSDGSASVTVVKRSGPHTDYHTISPAVWIDSRSKLGALLPLATMLPPQVPPASPTRFSCEACCCKCGPLWVRISCITPA